MRHDRVWQTAAERDTALSGSSTWCRWENRAWPKEAYLFHPVLFEQFVAGFETPLDELTADFDAMDNRVHGTQVMASTAIIVSYPFTSSAASSC